ncbi:MAG: DsrE family protein [Solirubrobacterales bacterium]
MSQKLLFILNDGPYGTERSYNALRLARSAVKQDSVELRIFLFGDAAACAVAGQVTPDGYYNVDRMLRDAIRRGAETGVCGTCLDARGLRELPLTEGAMRSTLDVATEWTLWADKVIVF